MANDDGPNGKGGSQGIVNNGSVSNQWVIRDRATFCNQGGPSAAEAASFAALATSVVLLFQGFAGLLLLGFVVAVVVLAVAWAHNRHLTERTR